MGRFDYYIDDDEYLSELLKTDLFPGGAEKIDLLTTNIINDTRDNKSVIGSIEDLLHSFGLDTAEGLALMALAEALLRIPDEETANIMIESKLNDIHIENLPSDDNLFIRAMSWGLGVAQKIVQKDDRPETFIKSAIRKLGIPSIRKATYYMIELMSDSFIMGKNIAKAMDNREPGLHYSFDMLGEGARDKETAAVYFKLYNEAIENVGVYNKDKEIHQCQSVSIKISALHPKFFPAFREKYCDEVYNILLALVSNAHRLNVPITIDAEEAMRLEWTFDIFKALRSEKKFQGWNGIGLVVQAYQKRASQLIAEIIKVAKKQKAVVPIRLVKGAYWDSEVKHAQENGIEDFPVFTRKAATDVNYLACAKILFDNRTYVYPQAATHNALTIAQLVELSGESGEGWELQRLHGMGEQLYDSVTHHCPFLRQRVYAPVGHYKDLLSYLVRRLLENGANSSFVNAMNKKDIPTESFLKRPHDALKNRVSMRHSGVNLPKDIFFPRKNSKGFEVGYQDDYEFLKNVATEEVFYNGPVWSTYSDQASAPTNVLSPIDGLVIGSIHLSSTETANLAMENAHKAFFEWRNYSAASRANIFHKAADLFEEKYDFFIPYLVHEAGKTVQDAIADIREGIDFLRYYAHQIEDEFSLPNALPGPNGERNVHFYAPRGVFVCISPWNFPFAIFMGQFSAAILAGNTVVAKPAEQTPLISLEIEKIFLEAGLPENVLNIVNGEGDIGAALIAHEKVAGVAFTGSTEVAKIIHRTMANSELAIRPMIAETGGLNAMIVDSTALLEQVTDDVLASAFQSAGQRCSALRLLIVQKDIADDLTEKLQRAAFEMVVGNPSEMATEVGPVIDRDAYENIQNYLKEHKDKIILDGTKVTECDGYYIAPTILQLSSIDEFNREVFAPILHILSYETHDLDNVLDALDAKGYGLTLGVHSRIAEFAQSVAYRMHAGNVYINRNIIGAVVGSQPFGGVGLSGTGPKAGGPDYIKRFMVERVISTNIAAAGGDPELMVLPSD